MAIKNVKKGLTWFTKYNVLRYLLMFMMSLPPTFLLLPLLSPITYNSDVLFLGYICHPCLSDLGWLFTTFSWEFSLLFMPLFFLILSIWGMRFKMLNDKLKSGRPTVCLLTNLSKYREFSMAEGKVKMTNWIWELITKIQSFLSNWSFVDWSNRGLQHVKN